MTSLDEIVTTLNVTHIYHEKQYLQRCALHALNNLFQAEIFTKKQLDDICLRLSPSYLLNPHRSAFGLGNYDINVIETALQGVGCVALWFDKRKDVRSIDLANIVGLIINVPVNSKIFNFSLPFATRRHWVGIFIYHNMQHYLTAVAMIFFNFSIRKINGKFYNLDSKLTSAQCIGSDEEMLQYIFQILTNKGVQMFIIVRKEIFCILAQNLCLANFVRENLKIDCNISLYTVFSFCLVCNLCLGYFVPVARIRCYFLTKVLSDVW
ncbi:josephin-2 [Trichinella spiralis]|uniref:josephin-2 n=1 Tax=Trichinella spiralis TaxID=6334 RepID=UPI0001EFD57C|nr:josephin-2 [Trichinella spiralis]